LASLFKIIVISFQFFQKLLGEKEAEPQVENKSFKGTLTARQFLLYLSES
jgi:hypothetical protein